LRKTAGVEPFRIGVRVVLALAHVICALTAILGQQVTRAGGNQERRTGADRRDLPVLLRESTVVMLGLMP
jgi:hypothetical protein